MHKIVSRRKQSSCSSVPTPAMADSLVLGILTIKLCFLSLFISYSSAAATDVIAVNQSLTDDGGQKTIVSAGGIFELGFFSPGGRISRRYLGIWYKRTPGTVVWVANRERPVVNATGVLQISREDGNLVITDQSSGTLYWSTNTTGVLNRVAQLQDSGNLVLNDSKTGAAVWQSFDNPGNTMLQGMKLGKNLKTGKEWFLSSWKSSDDPAVGDYTLSFDFHAYANMVIKRGSSVITHSRASYLPGRQPAVLDDGFYKIVMVSTEEEQYAYFTMTSTSLIAMLVLNLSGFSQNMMMAARASSWTEFYRNPASTCDNFGLCGAYGVCNDNELYCRCLPGFESRLPLPMNTRDGSDRCERRAALQCGSADGFVKVPGVKLPGPSDAVVDLGVVGDERCQELCRRNCSCTAYGVDVKAGGPGCITWFGRLDDVMMVPEGGQEFYLRLAASEIAAMRHNFKHDRSKIIAAAVPVFLVLILLSCVYFVWKQRKKNENKRGTAEDSYPEDPELPMFDFNTILLATNNFSKENQIGEGGFGVVYKGVLHGSQEIAIKKLSIVSKQGTGEFMNEAKLIAKLQHRNLVRLLGCCIQGDDRMLIYEYMPNKSLDNFIFDETRRNSLNWRKRMEIILGIARGILYLHHDSRLKIIHRDLKAGNILLDNDMNPKISDFGTARLFGSDQVEDTTKRVIGTYGYMSPEYAMDGVISTKSDIFSFGVILLEVVSGRKNRGVYHADSSQNLLVHAWRLWTEGRFVELLDNMVTGSCAISEVRRCIHVGLLCVQDSAADRPSMSSVVMMLGSENYPLPQPKEPGYLKARRKNEGCTSSSAGDSSGTASNLIHSSTSDTVNSVTLTGVIGR